MAKYKKLLPPIHPGEILREDFMVPLGLSMNRLALELQKSQGIAEQSNQGEGTHAAEGVVFGCGFVLFPLQPDEEGKKEHQDNFQSFRRDQLIELQT